MDKGKEPCKNVRLIEGQEPITVSGIAIVGHDNPTLRFPTEELQRAGWCSSQAALIVRCYGDRYELLTGGCNCNA